MCFVKGVYFFDPNQFGGWTVHVCRKHVLCTCLSNIFNVNGSRNLNFRKWCMLRGTPWTILKAKGFHQHSCFRGNILTNCMLTLAITAAPLIHWYKYKYIQSNGAKRPSLPPDWWALLNQWTSRLSSGLAGAGGAGELWTMMISPPGDTRPTPSGGWPPPCTGRPASCCPSCSGGPPLRSQESRSQWYLKYVSTTKPSSINLTKHIISVYFIV